MSDPVAEADDTRARNRAAWERVAPGWGRQADNMRRAGMPVSVRMVELAQLHPGQRVLELASGPGDTGFMAAELLAPGGVLISSDGAEGMLAVARERAQELGIGNVEFRQLELEWIDMPTADVDVILCRWGLMLCVDPAAAVAECRRVLKPGGRLVAAVWDEPERNPDMVLPGKVMVSLGLMSPPPADGPGPFALSAPGALADLLQAGGFVEPVVERVEIHLQHATVRDWVAETVDLSNMFGQTWRGLAGEDRQRVLDRAAELTREFTAPDGSLTFPGSCLVALAEA